MLDRISTTTPLTVAIAPLAMGEASIKLRGTAPYVMNRMGELLLRRLAPSIEKRGKF
jgi:hypothetical protein